MGKDKTFTTWKLDKVDIIDDVAWGMLLLADETREAVGKYLGENSETYVMRDKDTNHPIGIVVIHRDKADNSIEIKNIAVKEDLQSNGVGTKIIEHVKTIAKDEWYTKVIVGTSIVTKTGQRRLQFYESNGFQQYDVKKDFFVHNYSEPVIEDWEQLTDMVMFEYRIV